MRVPEISGALFFFRKLALILNVFSSFKKIYCYVAGAADQ